MRQKPGKGGSSVALETRPSVATVPVTRKELTSQCVGRGREMECSTDHTTTQLNRAPVSLATKTKKKFKHSLVTQHNDAQCRRVVATRYRAKRAHSGLRSGAAIVGLHEPMGEGEDVQVEAPVGNRDGGEGLNLPFLPDAGLELSPDFAHVLLRGEP